MSPYLSTSKRTWQHVAAGEYICLSTTTRSTRMLSIPPIDLSERALEFWVAHRFMRDGATVAAVAELGEIAEAYALALHVVASASSRVAERFVERTPESARRDSILAGYMVGLTLVESAILGGYNAQAAALVRQELEAIAALQEIRRGARRERQTPNVRHVPSVPGRLYGELSNAAHFSDSATLRTITAYRGEIEGAPGATAIWLLSPQHIPEGTRRLFALHTLLLLHFAEHQAEHYHERHGLESTDEEVQSVERALILLEQAGAIESAA